MCRGVSIGAFSPTTALKIEKKGKLRDTWELGNDFLFLSYFYIHGK